MMTSTMAISTSVKPLFLECILISLLTTCPGMSKWHATRHTLINQLLTRVCPRRRRRNPDTVSRLPTSPTGGSLLHLLQSPGQELRLARVLDVAAGEHATEQDTRGLELVHVLENEDFHLPRPEGHVRRARVAVDRRGIAAGERQVLQPVLGEQGGMRQRGPAP